MKYSFLIPLVIIIFLNACSTNDKGKGKLSDKDLESIVLIGGSLISGMEDYAFFEYELIKHFPESKLKLRNIGWPADDVFGTARSQFGSAQNTQSWQPPSLEKGFGSKVLSNHLKEANPTTLIIGYGPETAYHLTEEEFDLFCSGYISLLDLADSISNKIILLSPPKQEIGINSPDEVQSRNALLKKTRDFIAEEATERGLAFIDLYERLIQNSDEAEYTYNGIQLNANGYKKLSDILKSDLNLDESEEIKIAVDEDAQILSNVNCTISDWKITLNGAKFKLTPNKFLNSGFLQSESPIAIIVNGKLLPKSQETENHFFLYEDSLQHVRLMNLIKEKNQLYRYRLRPLNEAYIYLFRRHEMGHLAYEMDDLEKLVSEKEDEIKGLKFGNEYDIELELIKPWQPPKNYPEDEVPLFIPEPDIAEEIKSFNISDEYEINLFASDPMIANPINVNWDSRGRAWVATSSTYPHIVPGREPNDKIVILEDTDNDGKADKHTVFAQNLLVPHSVMPVKGGAYVTATTQILFLADTDGDDKADETRVVFDGFGNADIHHTIHGLRWTPWGDLQFTQSIYINSFIETVDGPRILNGSGIWNFRPETESLNIFSRGLINPWGKALDKWGQSFATDGAGSSGINYVFPESAHATAVGAKNVIKGLNSNTPKNTSAEVIYSKHFPAQWQGSIITNDFRANRTVRYKLEASESGYSSEEVETILDSDHRSYRPVDTKIGPDGALYIVDWYNPIIDHGEVDFHHPIRDKTHGRIWRLTSKKSPLLEVINFEGKSADFILEKLKSNEQFVRIQANRAFVEQIGDAEKVVKWIKNLSGSHPNFNLNRLEGLWLLAALNHYDENLLLLSISSRNPNERAAAVRLLGQYERQSEHMELLNKLIRDNYPQVRLETLHVLRQMGGADAAEIAIKVLENKMDENLEFALDLTLEKLKDSWIPELNNGVFGGQKNLQLYAALTTEDERVIPLIRSSITSENIKPDLVDKGWILLAKIGDSETKETVLNKAISEEELGLLNALIYAPEKYDAAPDELTALQKGIVHDSIQLRIASLKLVERWKPEGFEEQVEKISLEADNFNEQLSALRALQELGQEEKIQEWANSNVDQGLRTAATIVKLGSDTEGSMKSVVNFLSTLEDPKLGERIFSAIKGIEGAPESFIKELEGKTIPESIANVGLKVVHTSGLNLFDMEKALRKAGSIKSLGRSLNETEKMELITEAKENGNSSRGRQIYRRPELLCATCHTINNIGGLSGPNLTTLGSYMTPNSILESILNPNSDIKQGYETVIVTKKNGEVLTGLLHRKTGDATIIRQSNSQLLEVPSSEIEKTDASASSLMPIGLTNSLTKDELKDLIAYLIRLGN